MIEENSRGADRQLSKTGKIPKTMFQRTLYTAGPKPKISP